MHVLHTPWGYIAANGADKKMADSISRAKSAAKPEKSPPSKHCDARKAKHPETLKKNMVQRLRRIEGQIRGVSKMVEEDVYCDDILHQIMAIESALSGVKRTLLKAHIEGCVIDRLKNGEEHVLEELMGTMTKMMK